MTDREPVLSIRDLTKEFSGVRVLDSVSVDIYSGEIFAIIGENGAGKSTLLKTVSGIYTPTSGQVVIAGERVVEFTPGAARRRGVTMIPQEFNLVGHLTVFENIFLGHEPRGRFGILDKRAMRDVSARLLESLGSGYISPNSRLSTLSPAQRQMVEIAKALANDNSRIIIMDEPTTVLNQKEVDVLFQTMRDLKARGVTVIYISHKLREVKAISDRVMVLRDGEFILVDDTENLSERDMAMAMVGRELTQVFPEKAVPSDEIALEVEDLSSPGTVRSVSFSVRKGEVFGLAGLMGAGRTETAEALMGLRRRRGTVRVYGDVIPPNRPESAVAAGLAYLSEDRQGKGILTQAGITENTSLASLDRYVSHGFLSNAARRRAAEKYVGEFSVRAANLGANLEFFSGGNQQKVSLAKCLDTEPRVLIFDEPTRGIDIKAKSDIYRFIQALARSGLACILISSEMEEIIGLCHRVLVLHEGEATGILEAGAITEEEIMLHATRLKTSESSRAAATAVTAGEGGR